jgi:hypothetical protein
VHYVLNLYIAKPIKWTGIEPRCLVPGKCIRNFLFAVIPRIVLRSIQLLIQWISLSLLPGVMSTNGESDNLHSCNAENV